MYIKRKLEATIIKYLKTKEILAIVGPRQAGKTTLLKKIKSNLENSVYITFEDREDLELFEQNIKFFAEKFKHYRYLIIDEFQYSKRGGKHLKFLVDLYPEIKIVISGSWAIDLTIRAIKFLVGRVFVFHLYQLDFEEYLDFKNQNLNAICKDIKSQFNLLNGDIHNLPPVPEIINHQINEILEEFIIWGGYPRIFSAKTDEEKRLILKNIYSTYFLRDIKDILGLADDFRLTKLIKGLALQTGQLIEYNELGLLSDYDYLTLKKYLNILDKTFICQLVRPHYKNKRKEIVKNPKVYFFDTGFRNYTINDFNQLPNRIDKGFLYENFVFTQFIKQERIAQFWRAKTHAEVDFIIEVSGELVPIECKSALGSRQIEKGMASFIDQYKIPYGIVLNSNQLGTTKYQSSTIYFLPWWIV